MKIRLLIVMTAIILFSAVRCGDSQDADTTIRVRGLADTVGFSYTEDQIKRVVAMSEALEADNLNKIHEEYESPWIAGVCPHDDHLLAGRVYVSLFQNFKARRCVIFGVAHKAKNWGVRDKLIFDSYDYWSGPYGPVTVSSLREEIIRRLPEDAYTVNDSWQAEEHSVEGIVPFLQHYVPGAEIVSILVPYMAWDRLDELSGILAEAIGDIIAEEKWRLGDDLGLIFSNDGDHYGDEDWGDKDYAEFGVDEEGYRKATQRDLDLIKLTLTGELHTSRLKLFSDTVLGDDVYSYKIRWCGRFSVPFGLNTLYYLAQKAQKTPVEGYLLRYDTSYGLGKMSIENIGLGTTAPNHIRHWVGYSAIGYR